ncbi:Glycine/D-amino acid oxidase-like deaminating enzyme [Tenacibaculum sp. 190524A02b]|uniref:NAD(P)/FAD-dependent oxidoreductase n=1 Tax=Tenacibaculum vairaonense TaxID=3137860 RepID=UPI0032B0F2D3
MREVDYIIVGLGLAGLAFVEKLLENNLSFVVFEDASEVSSIVAGGVYNPVILKRFTPAWNGHKQLVYALPFYEKIEKRLQVNFDTKFTTRKVFNSISDQNNWFTALDKPNLSLYMKSDILRDTLEGVYGDFGFGELEGTGKIDTKLLLDSYKKDLEEKGNLISESFVYDNLKIEKELLNYENIKAKKIVFSEGYGLKRNPYFNYLPLMGTKGETLTIIAPDLNIDFLLKSSVFVLPLGNDKYKVGATFNWTDKTSLPTEEGKEELVKKLEKVISVPYKIIEQSAGIRPTIKDRKPLVGKHPEYENLAILNGLGTRGVMIAPTIANNLFNHLESGIALDKEINITRFQQKTT